MKKIAPTWYMRMQAGKKFGMQVFLALFFTAIVALVTLFSASGIIVPWQISIPYGLIISSIIGLIAAYLKGQLELIPNIVIDEIKSNVHFTAELCSSKRLEEACEMTKPYYHKEYVPSEIAEQWRIKNNYGFVDIVNTDGTLCACFGILALKKSFLDHLLEGIVSDTQMRGNHVLSLSESKKASHLYISGVVVRNATKWAGSKHATIMLWVMLEFVRQIYGLKRKRILFAVAVTKPAERLLVGLGFKLEMDKKNRVDKCNLYTYELTKSSWELLLNKVGDHSRLCTLKFKS